MNQTAGRCMVTVCELLMRVAAVGCIHALRTENSLASELSVMVALLQQYMVSWYEYVQAQVAAGGCVVL